MVDVQMFIFCSQKLRSYVLPFGRHLSGRRQGSLIVLRRAHVWEDCMPLEAGSLMKVSSGTLRVDECTHRACPCIFSFRQL
jgi:hypothetical protein